MKEIYKDIKNYKKLYKISNLGNVLSLSKGDGNGNKDRLLLQESTKKQHTTYKRVTLSKKGKTKRFLVHRLVAEAFLPNDNNKPHINHLDNNGSNNTVTNIEWCTHSENMKYCAKQDRTGLPKAWEAHRIKSINNFKSYYKKYYIKITYEIEQNKPRAYITYLCKVCTNKATKRSDSVLAKLIVCSRKCKTACETTNGTP